MRLEGTVLLVTGAGSGIGRATALLGAREGWSVVVADLSEGVHDTAAAIVAGGGECISVKGDVRKAEDCEEMVRVAEHELGRFGAVVHAAAVSVGGSVTTLDEKDWHRVIETDLSSAFYVGRATVPALDRNGGGAIVFVASQLGLVGARNSAAYTAAKGGLINLARSMALDHAGQGIRVNCLCPGPVDTPFLRSSFERQPDPSAARRELLSRVPIGRFGTPEEVAWGALFLSSPHNTFTTGAALVMDGGYLAQ
jgi:NAD(P)-dependent dehydrogenase (short-subunit alcohol dehydrogenase family)